MAEARCWAFPIALIRFGEQMAMNRHHRNGVSRGGCVPCNAARRSGQFLFVDDNAKVNAHEFKR
ncbi:hypothetical protein NS334_12420 [Sphingomonas endophytica]|uniref:Uncharacterized protein n=2 Tax=Sphingomonas endophytica TaxID=869719 RepID=A0A147HZM0_9SPHN|nr:hypothetical protein NS334_12420 [Sphingomonas endophytica]